MIIQCGKNTLPDPVVIVDQLGQEDNVTLLFSDVRGQKTSRVIKSLADALSD